MPLTSQPLDGFKPYWTTWCGVGQRVTLLPNLLGLLAGTWSTPESRKWPAKNPLAWQPVVDSFCAFWSFFGGLHGLSAFFKPAKEPKDGPRKGHSKVQLSEICDLRLDLGAAFYEDILDLLLRGYRGPNEDEFTFLRLLQKLPTPGFPEMAHLREAGENGVFFWDGRAWRFFLQWLCKYKYAEPKCARKAGFLSGLKVERRHHRNGG